MSTKRYERKFVKTAVRNSAITGAAIGGVAGAKLEHGWKRRAAAGVGGGTAGAILGAGQGYVSGKRSIARTKQIAPHLGYKKSNAATYKRRSPSGKIVIVHKGKKRIKGAINKYPKTTRAVGGTAGVFAGYMAVHAIRHRRKRG